MIKVALLVRLKAKPGKESAVVKFLEGALPLANQETTTPVWFAFRLGPSTFGIFDAFADDAGRKAHLAGPIAAALLANAAELLAKAPQIEQVDPLAVKLPKWRPFPQAASQALRGSAPKRSHTEDRSRV